jgi:hypothetical protein
MGRAGDLDRVREVEVERDRDRDRVLEGVRLLDVERERWRDWRVEVLRERERWDAEPELEDLGLRDEGWRLLEFRMSLIMASRALRVGGTAGSSAAAAAAASEAARAVSLRMRSAVDLTATRSCSILMVSLIKSTMRSQ